jgi:hypothetical protein
MKMDDIGTASIEKGAEAPGNFWIKVALRKALQVGEGIIEPRDRNTVADHDINRVLGLGQGRDPRKDTDRVTAERQGTGQMGHVGLCPPQALRWQPLHDLNDPQQRE